MGNEMEKKQRENPSYDISQRLRDNVRENRGSFYSSAQRTGLLLAGVSLLALPACNTLITPTPIVPTQAEIPDITQTAEPTQVSTVFPKLEVAIDLSNAGGTYSEEQLAVIYSEGFEERVHVINNWWSYWGNPEEDQRPFHPESKNIHIIPFFDEKNLESFSLAIQAKMDDGNWHTFLLPIDLSKGNFREFPPVEFGSNGIPLETGYDIPEGFGPLEVTGNIRWTEDSGWVRLDESGEISEVLNMKTAQWEVLPEPEYEVLATNSIDNSVSLTRIDYASIYFEDYTERSGYSNLYAPAYLLSYEYGKKGDENYLYLLFVNKKGIIRVQADILYMPDFDIYKPVNDLSDKEIEKTLNLFDNYFSMASQEKSIVYTGYEFAINLIGVSNSDESDQCKKDGKLTEPIGNLCVYDSLVNTPSKEEISQSFSDAFTPRGNSSIWEIMNNNEEYQTLISDNNTQILIQFSLSYH